MEHLRSDADLAMHVVGRALTSASNLRWCSGPGSRSTDTASASIRSNCAAVCLPCAVSSAASFQVAANQTNDAGNEAVEERARRVVVEGVS